MPTTEFKNAFAPLTASPQTAGDQYINMNNAGVAPISAPALACLKYWGNAFAMRGTFAAREIAPIVSQTRSKLAQLIGAKPNEIAFFQSTAAAVSQLAFGIGLRPGEEVLTWDQEYPSSVYPWLETCKRHGAKLVRAPSQTAYAASLEKLLTLVTERTRVIALSWVQFQTGAITDLKALSEFARPRGILTCVDVVQGLGMLPFHFAESGIDAVSGGSHKWLVSPLSVGYLCLREGLIDSIPPLMVGAITYGTPDDPVDERAKPRAGAERFEPGSKNVIEIAALGASLDLFLKIGVEQIAQEIEWLSRTLAHELRSRDYIVHSPHGIHHRGSIVNFTPGPHTRHQTCDAVALVLDKAGVSYARRPPGIRLSPHAFNTRLDIENIVALL